VTAHEACVLGGLVSGEVCHEPSIGKGGRVAVDDKHATGVPGPRKDLAYAAPGVGVAGERVVSARRVPHLVGGETGGSGKGMSRSSSAGSRGVRWLLGECGEGHGASPAR